MTARGDEWSAAPESDGEDSEVTWNLHAILDALPALVSYWDANLRNRLANDAYMEFFGLTPQQIRGAHVRDVLGPMLYEQNRPFIEAALAGEKQVYDRTVTTASGELRHTQISYIPDVFGGRVRGLFVLVSDITARHEAERAVAVAEARFRTLFASAPIATYLSDSLGLLLDVNPAGAKLLGASHETLLGKLTIDFAHPDDREVCSRQFLRLVSGELPSYQLETRYVRADGQTIWVQLDVTALREPADPGLVVLAQVQDVSDRRRYEARLIELAEHDDLTGLLNRRAFQRELQRHIAHARRYGPCGALLVIDLDNFKDINDTLGHKAGDDLLAHLAGRMSQRLRSSDVLARLGGDEFAVILPHASVEQALAVARSLVSALHAEPQLSPIGIQPVTMSVGLVAFDAEVSADQILIRADQAMYDAKRGGKASIAHSSGGATARLYLDAWRG
jgi:diguanylate cyclase (GGDEF)-like protein/PAS domain S-box-containing protein